MVLEQCSRTFQIHTGSILSILIAFIVYTAKGDTCIDYRQPQLNSSCILKSEVVECYVDLADLGCGPGNALVEFTNCPPLLMPCCVPCNRQLIIDEDCTAEYCRYGRLPPTAVYSTSQECRYKVGKWSHCHKKLLFRQRQDAIFRQNPDCAPINVIERTCKPTEIVSQSEPDYPWHNPYLTMSYNSSVRLAHTRVANPSENLMRRQADNPAVDSHFTTNTAEDTNINCVYKSNSTWSACDPDTEMRILVRTLDPISPVQCPKNITETRSCFTRSGKERCFYSKWSRWSQCEDYIQKREREILYGNKSDCQRRHKIRACQPVARVERRRRRHRQQEDMT